MDGKEKEQKWISGFWRIVIYDPVGTLKIYVILPVLLYIILTQVFCPHLTQEELFTLGWTCQKVDQKPNVFSASYANEKVLLYWKILTLKVLISVTIIHSDQVYIILYILYPNCKTFFIIDWKGQFFSTPFRWLVVNVSSGFFFTFVVAFVTHALFVCFVGLNLHCWMKFLRGKWKWNQV